jgi:50S ribosomal subunit-associated GTPase HflX
MTARIARKIKVDGYLNSAKQPRFNLTVGNKTHTLDLAEIRQLMSDIRSELEYIDRERNDNGNDRSTLS